MAKRNYRRGSEYQTTDLIELRHNYSFLLSFLYVPCTSSSFSSSSSFPVHLDNCCAIPSSFNLHPNFHERLCHGQLLNISVSLPLFFNPHSRIPLVVQPNTQNYPRRHPTASSIITAQHQALFSTPPPSQYLHGDISASIMSGTFFAAAPFTLEPPRFLGREAVSNFSTRIRGFSSCTGRSGSELSGLPLHIVISHLLVSLSLEISFS